MVFKPICCVCGQEIRPWHLFWMPTPGEHICIPCSEKDSCSEKEDPEEEEKENYIELYEMSDNPNRAFPSLG